MKKSPNLLRVQFAVLLLGTGLMLIKFIAHLLTQSNAILSDALESIINVAAGAFAVYSLWLSQKPKDLDHPYGHGKIEFISIGFEGGMIILAAFYILFEAIHSFIGVTVYFLLKFTSNSDNASAMTLFSPLYVRM